MPTLVASFGFGNFDLHILGVAPESGKSLPWFWGSDRFTINVPACVTTLRVNASSGSGNVDLFVKSGSNASISNYDCR